MFKIARSGFHFDVEMEEDKQYGTAALPAKPAKFSPPKGGEKALWRCHSAGCA
jgi:hypothetical protein